MHPEVVRTQVGQCPKCGMPLVKRNRGQAEQLPADVLARVTLTPKRKALAGIATTAVEYKTLVREIRSVAVLDYDETKVAHISARVPGRADELFVQYTGQAVKRGDPVYSLYSPDVYTAQRDYLRARKQINDLQALKQAIKSELLKILQASENQGVASETSVPLDVLPYVMMIVGVNGVGKTTTIGKLAQRIKAEGNDVLICWKRNHTIYPAIFLPQLLQLLSLPSPTPTIDEPHHDYANNQGNGCSSYPRPSAKSVGHAFLDYAGQCDHQHHGQQFNQRIC